MSKLAKALKTNDLSQLAHLLRSAGRGGDTVLAHITPREAALLKKRGGSGTKNPKTGLPEFDDGGFTYDPGQNTTFTMDTPSSTAYQPGSSPIETISAPSSSTFSYDPNAQGVYNAGTSAQPYSSATDISTYGYSPAAFTAGPQGGTAQSLVAAGGGAGVPVAAQPALAASPTTAVGPTSDTSGQQSPGFLTKAENFLNNNQGLARLGLAGGLALMGANKAKQGANQIANVTGQEQAIAAPYQQQGQALIGAAQRGELSPASAQAYQAAQAQLRQGVESRGGVGAQQSQVQLEAFRQQLLQNQYTYGLSIAQIGDNIALGAIKTGLQLDQQLNAATQSYYTQLAVFAAGGNPFQQKQQGTV